MKNKELEDLLQKEYMRGFADAEKIQRCNSKIHRNAREVKKGKRVCKQIMRCRV